MTRSFLAELRKLARRRPLAVTAAVTVAFSVAAAFLVLASAADTVPSGPDGRGVTVASLAGAGGGTEVFRLAVSFVGPFVLVVFAGALAVEFSRGTVRTMLLRQPDRLRLLAGKVGALLAFASSALALGAVATWTAARLLAASQGVDAGAWASGAGLAAGLADLGAVVAWVAGYGLLGASAGVLLRSVPVALAVAIAWTGPLEHIVQDAWSPAGRLFPGLLLEAFVAGGTDEVTAGRALATAAAYTAVAAAAAAATFARRDVTA